jgi:phosphoribosylformimino-5-aminoimidazole carboxamide ribotide isomerase
LDAAFGKGDNTQHVAEVVRVAGVPVQVGGGIRTLDAAEKLLSLDVEHIILGALAFSNPDVIPQIQKKFGTASVIVALDNKNGKVMVEGWKTQTAFAMSEALERFSKLGAKTFLITSITKDGMLQGPDFETLRQAVQHSDVQVIAAGGIGSVDDLVELKKVGVEGVVVGKALYEAKFTLKEAIAAVETD